MKYERLSLGDLQDLEKEFVEFLVVNGITADEWERLKKEENEKAEQIIDQFSDVIWEGILRKTEMVERRRRNAVTVYKVKEGVLSSLLLEVNEHEDFNLLETEDIYELITDPQKYYITVRHDKIDKSEPEQLFEFIKEGFFITKEPKYVELFEKYGK